MIPVNASLWQTESWQQQLRNLIREPAELLRRLQLDAAEEPGLAAALKQFPLRVPEAFVAKMERGNWRDPLLLQVLPQGREALPQAGYHNDPLEEAAANPVPGLIHKYASRVLLITTPACAIHCRYCFRRHFPYQENSPGLQQSQQALDYIASQPSIHEVILSGGDPLSLPDHYLGQLVQRLAAIEHLDTLRIHSRLPLVLPARVTEALVAQLSSSRLQVVMVIHCNHANEMDEFTLAAMARLRRAGIQLLNQSVLLAGVNDSAPALIALSRKLFGQGVLPYYLHLLDKVEGAAHFDVDEPTAVALVRGMQQQLPGYLLPRLVRELPGAQSKVAIAL